MKDPKIKDILLGYQKKWVADDADVKIAEKSRRVGLTWAEAADDVLLAARSNGMDVYYISYNFEFCKEFIGTCASWARDLQKAASEIEEEIIKDGEDEFRAYKIVFPSGHKIMGLPARATTIRGRQGKIVIDEAAFCENLDELQKAAMALLMWGGKVVFISTHNGEDNVFNEKVKATRLGKLPYSLHRITIHDALEDGLYKRICQKKREEWTSDKEKVWLDRLIETYGDGAAEELFCIPSKGGGRYMSSALIETCQSPDIPVIKYNQTDGFAMLPESERNRLTEDWIKDNLAPVLKTALEVGTYIGEDFARSGDLTVIVISQKLDDIHRRGLCNIELRNISFDQQLKIMRYIFDNLSHIWGASLDARGNGQMLAEMLAQDYGSDIVNQVMISTGFYAEFMPLLKSRFESRELEIPASIGIIEDFRLVTMIKGVPRIPDARSGEKGMSGKLRHGDTVVAECMVEHAIKNDSGYQEYSYEGIRQTNDFKANGGEDDSDWDME